jgi:hypothetical protein
MGMALRVEAAADELGTATVMVVLGQGFKGRRGVKCVGAKAKAERSEKHQAENAACRKRACVCVFALHSEQDLDR